MNRLTRRGYRFLSLLLLVLGLGLPGSVNGYTIEEFDPLDPVDPSDYGDGPENQEDIHVEGCTEATDGMAVYGMDCAGEWIRTRVHLAQESTFYELVSSAGDSGFVRHFEVQFLDDFTQEVIRADILETPLGLGLG